MVLELVQGFLSDALGCEPSEIAESADLFEDLGLGPVELEDLIAALADELGFREADMEKTRLQTVRDLVSQAEALA